MTVSVNTQFDCSQRELIDDIARIIYAKMGFRPAPNVRYFFDSQHPREEEILAMAEEIYELVMGDSPSYEDEEEKK